MKFLDRFIIIICILVIASSVAYASSKLQGSYFVNQGDFDFNPSSYNDNWGFGIRLLVLGNPLRLDFGIPITSTEIRDPNGNVIYNNDTGNQFNFSFGTRF